MAIDKVVDSAVLDADMKSVADDIRAKAGTTDLLAWPDGFAEAIRNIQTGSPEQEKSVTITANGTTEITPDEGKQLKKVTVEVDVPDWETWVFNEKFSNIPIVTDSKTITVGGEIIAFIPEANEEMAIQILAIRILRTKVFGISFFINGNTSYAYKNQVWINPLCRKIRIRKGYQVSVSHPTVWDEFKTNIAIQNSNIAIQPSKTVKSHDMVNFPYEIEPDPPFDGIAKVIITAD